MNTGMFLLLFNTPVANSTPECDDLKRDMIALELFLKDKEDKKELKSQLPEGCLK